MDKKRQYDLQAQQISDASPSVESASPVLGPDGRRLLHVYHKGFFHPKTRVMDSDQVTPVYDIEHKTALFGSKPHMIISNAADGVVVGTVRFHSMSSSINLEIYGKAFLLKQTSFFSSAHEFFSLVTGKLFKWKPDGFFTPGNLKCVDEMDQTVAGFEMSNWTIKKGGKFALGPAVQGPLTDEVLITGLAVMELQRRRRAEGSGAYIGSG